MWTVRAKPSRTWSVVREGRHGPSGYHATLAKLKSEYAAVAGFNVAAWLLAIFTWLGDFDIFGSEPRYRVLVGRDGTEDVIGVRQARTLHKGEEQMVEVETILARSTEEEVRHQFGLEF